MILDAFLLFTGVVPAASIGNADNTDSPTTGTQASTNVLDLHVNSPSIPILANLQGARDIGIGDTPALKILAVVTVAFVSGTSMSLSLQGAPDNGSGSPGSYATWYTTPVYTEAQLVVGARLMDMDMPRPPAGIGVPRFLRLSYVTVGTHTVGKLLAGLVLDRHDQMYQSTNNAILGGYPAGITVSN